MRRYGIVAAWAGLLAVQFSVASAYLVRGTWWHWLLHQLVGWGIGLAVAALLLVTTARSLPVVVALLAGQLVSIAPDLQFRFQRMPHMAWMDVYLGHISLHTGPSPTLVALGILLLGGWGWLAAAYGRPRLAVGLAVGAGVLLLVATVLATPLPSQLSQYPRDTPPLAANVGTASVRG